MICTYCLFIWQLVFKKMATYIYFQDPLHALHSFLQFFYMQCSFFLTTHKDIAHFPIVLEAPF
jgi:hypothetical protein